MGEGTNYSSNTTGFKEVVMSQLKRITELGSHEMRGGYYTFISLKKGEEEKEVYIADSRENYSMAVLCLKHILIEEYDQKAWDYIGDFDANLRYIEKEFIKASSVEETIILGEGFYKKDEDKILFETYRMQKLQFFQDLFEELCKLLGRLNWLEIGGISVE